MAHSSNWSTTSLSAPGADPKGIQFQFDGVARPRLDAAGDLVLETGDEMRLRKPFLYQDINGVRSEISGGYSVHGRQVGFWTGPYNSTKPLVIDPVLVYETRLGQGWINGMAVDGAGNTWVAGSVWPQPTTFSPTEVLTKLDENGTPLYTTYIDGNIGGVGGISVYAVAVDTVGSAYITGYANKPDLPTVSAAQPAPGGKGDAFVGKLAPDGSGFVYLTYLGGSDNDGGTRIAVDLAGNAYVTGYSCSV